MVVELLRLAGKLSKGEQLSPLEAADVAMWMASGKNDRYKLKKALKRAGRSIQAPTILFKALWKLFFGVSDVTWAQHLKKPYHVGVNSKLPVEQWKVDLMVKAVAVGATDMTGYDRRMPADVMQACFHLYFMEMVPGLPHSVVDFFAKHTIHSVIAGVDGKLYQKHRGNPSGFPATLRLNSVVLRACTNIVWAHLLDCPVDEVEQHVFTEYCGDDSRSWALTPKSAAILLGATSPATGTTMLEEWDRCFHWEVKDEGRVALDGTLDGLQTAPHFISRKVVVMDGLVYNCLADPDRLVSKMFLVQEGDKRVALAVNLLLASDWLLVRHLYGMECSSP